jgi:antitoxin component YwqK of YwqJK toxin-antitoxin module
MTQFLENSNDPDATSQRNGAQAPLRRRVIFLLVAGGLVFSLWAILHWPEGAKPRELSRPELVLRAGRLYQAGQTEPFTGTMVESYSKGSLKSRSALSNGLLDGVSEGWHTNGQLAVREHFRMGVSHGLRTKWYVQSGKMSEAMIVQGKLHGTFRRWHENGALAEEVEMRNGNPDGSSQAFYASGFVKAQVRLQNGKVLEQQFWKDGEVRPGQPTAGKAN